jgi:tagatose-6-phosphate ketose/aldose isomerase
MKYLGMELSALQQRGAINTAKEISQQPELWQKIWEEIRKQRSELMDFFEAAVENSSRIVLTGAGTSAFIGLSLSGLYQRKTGLLAQAIATTDLVSHPHDYIIPGESVFLISFARSGNSPESVAAATLVEEIGRQCYHLVITCNTKGQLAQYGGSDRKLIFALPEEANDQSLAMTSSYTGMMLAAVLIAHADELDEVKKSVDTLTGYGRKVINYYAEELSQIAEKKFARAVFLGSGPLFGVAKESHLKLQELSDGKVICKEDTFLGLRHGPKAVIDETTLVFYIFSNDEYASRYERDLVHSMKKGHPPMVEVGIMENIIPGINLNHTLYLSDNGLHLKEEFLAVCCALPAQILGFFKSLQLGLKPDAPSATGAITRVVEGVQIYELKV